MTDVIAVKDHLARTKRLGPAGGAPYLHTLVAAPPTAANAGFYAQLVREKSVERALITTGQQLVQIGWSPGLDLDEKLDVTWQRLEEATDRASAPRTAAVAERIPRALEQMDRTGPMPGGVASPWPSLDEITGGAQPGQMITIAARPSVGKSVVLSNWAVAAAKAGVPVLYYSLEMSEAECLNRILAAEAGVSLTRIRDGALTDEDWDRLAGARDRLTDIPLRISDAGTVRPGDIRADLRRARRARQPAGLVAVDYVQLMTAAARRREPNRQAEVSEITGALKAVAKEHHAAVLVGAQLNRGPEMRSGHRPVPADMRDSGSLEQDSDAVIMLFREETYDPATTKAGQIDLMVEKNRGGPRGTVTLDFHGAHARCEEHPWDPSAAAASAVHVEDDLAARRAGRQPPF